MSQQQQQQQNPAEMKQFMLLPKELLYDIFAFASSTTKQVSTFELVSKQLSTNYLFATPRTAAHNLWSIVLQFKCIRY